MSKEMGFGESVSALLKTYDNCLKLLKAFKRQREDEDHGGRSSSREVAKANKQQSLLKHSLKADRKKVESAYLSRLTAAGSVFEKGDPKSRSSLSKVVKELNAAIGSLVRVASKSQSPALDYQALMTLSNSSRVQAIKTFDRLSRRLGKASVGSATSSASAKALKSPTTASAAKSATAAKMATASKTATAAKTAKTAKMAKPIQATTKPSGSKAPKTTSSPGLSKDDLRKGSPRVPKGHRDGGSSARKSEPRDSRRNGKRPTRPPGTLRKHARTPLPDPAVNSNVDGPRTNLGRAASFLNRFSLMSMSSDTTKLGEIPEKKWHRKYDPADGKLDEYNTPVMYPLRPYQPQPKEKKFLGLFRRG